MIAAATLYTAASYSSSVSHESGILSHRDLASPKALTDVKINSHFQLHFLGMTVTSKLTLKIISATANDDDEKVFYQVLESEKMFGHGSGCIKSFCSHSPVLEQFPLVPDNTIGEFVVGLMPYATRPCEIHDLLLCYVKEG